MHIPDGLLPPALSVTGYALSISTALGIFLKARGQALVGKMTQISLMAAVVFVSSLIHIPMGFTSVHFTFAPLAGILLGPFSFLAVFLAIFLQWLLLGHGGITTLGINAFNMGFSALAACSLFYWLKTSGQKMKKVVFPAVLAATLAASLKVTMGSAFLVWGGFPRETFYLLLFAHIPVILGEGAIAGLAAHYILKLFPGRELYLHELREQNKLKTSTNAT